MIFFAYALTYSLGLFFGLLACIKVGHIVGRRRHIRDGEPADGGSGAIDGAVYGLVGLLLAFSFSGAITRYDMYRNLLVEEASAITGSYARLDLLPPTSQPALRSLMRQYVQARIDAYRAIYDSHDENTAFARGRELQDEMWTKAMLVAKDSGSAAVLSQVSDSLDRMFDFPARQHAAQSGHPPAVISSLMFVLAMMAALIAGYGMGSLHTMPLLRVMVFSAAMAITMYVIIDMEYPGSGFFNPDSIEQILVETLKGMN
ncbi:bestrophin-like domain [Paraburkholderia lycopersici]|uniref:DUF4239 domain-containing protein n=1 Tax=Paraburkholderia lycopersici TaxID=416944 RepID=A0A1G6SBV6_9BURK|nr:hypothetical protein [Paraburkholderia lycopersici]SDD14378.1 hypothetical protein SAMN05421548_11517 [Paraburkholderia lycopersici]